jgi:signal transduction histidine kinase
VPVQGRDEVAFLAERFNQSAERIESLVQSQNTLLASQKALLANASHELRSPLARIRMGLELLGGGGTDPASQSLQAELVRNIAELDSLVDELLLASRLDAREADLGTVESIDFTGLVAEECARAQLDLQVQVDSPPLVVRGVSILLRRLVRNLLQSSQRVTGAQPPSAHLLVEEGRVLLRVWDRNLKLSPELLARLFDPFWRAPGASERDGGVGLSLALVQAIAHRFHGSATAHPAPEGGSWLEVRLPLLRE